MSAEELRNELRRRENLVQNGQEQAALTTINEVQITNQFSIPDGKTKKKPSGAPAQEQTREGEEMENNEPQEDTIVWTNSGGGYSSSSSSKSGDDDDWGEFIEILSFNWKTKRFLIDWEKGGRREHNAKVVIEDWPEEALEVLWREHRDKLHVRAWVDKLMKKKENGYIDIENYAAQRNWEGSYDRPAVATAPVGGKGMNCVLLRLQ
jgi:hypothetical protein